MENEIISEYKRQESFIDKYKFYKKNKDDIRHIEPSNPLMINFVKASKELDDIEIKVRNGRTGAIYVTMTNEHFRLQENKNNAIKEIEKHYENEPLPSDSFEHGQVIEFEVSQYSFETFESLKDGFLLKRDSYHNEHGRNTYWQKRLNDSNSYLNGIKFKEVDLTDLVRCSLKADCVNIDFQLLYEDFTDKKTEPKDEFNLLPKISEQLFYERLAKVIPHILFIDFLEGLYKNKPDQAEEENLVLSQREIALIYHYEGWLLTDGNSNNEVSKYLKNDGTRHKSGKALIADYRIVNGEFKDWLNQKNTVKYLKKIIPLLQNTNGISDANEDLKQAIKNKESIL
jgi:hypothetical protein